MMEIDYQKLSPETLDNLLTEIVLREGTEYGEIEYSTVQKVRQLKAALQANKATIMFDPESEHCDIISK